MPAIKNQVEIWPVAKLRGYERNARTHSKAQIEQIAASIVEFGWTNPVLATAEGEIIAGHGRVAAAKRLGLDEAPVIVLDHLSDAQRRAYVIADNKLALNAGWDDEILAAELAALRIDEFDLELTGFSLDEIADFLDENAAVGAGGDAPKVRLSDRFMLPPFSVLNAREGWWQNRKRAWLALGIKSEIGRGGTPSTSSRVGPGEKATYRTIGGKAAPGGSARPACDYSKKQRGDGAGRPIA